LEENADLLHEVRQIPEITKVKRGLVKLCSVEQHFNRIDETISAKAKRAAVSVYCTTSFSVCSRRRTKMPIIYPSLRLDYKVATHPGKAQVPAHCQEDDLRLKLPPLE
jgi:hypothetical protein